MLKRLFFISALSILIFSFGSFVALADNHMPKPSGKGIVIDDALNPGGVPTIYNDEDSEVDLVDKTREELTRRIVSAVFGIAGIVAVFFIINNAWYMVASAGKEETLTQHKKGLMWAVIGLVLIILSYSIVRFIISIPFGADKDIVESAAPAAGAPAQPAS